MANQWGGVNKFILAVLAIATIALSAAVIAMAPAPAAAQDHGDAGDEEQDPQPEPRPQVLLVVEDLDDGVFKAQPGKGVFSILTGANRVELQLASVLSGFTDLLVVDDDEVEPEHLQDADLVIITASTTSQKFQPFYLKAAVPIIAMKPANWNALGLTTPAADATTPLQRVQSIAVDRSHPITDRLNARRTADTSPGVRLFTFGEYSVGRGPAARGAGDGAAAVVGAGPDGAAMLAFEPGDSLGWAYLDSSDTAVACRVAFPSNGSSEASYTGDGISLFIGAVEWALRDECKAHDTPIRPSTSALMCRTEAADETRIARNGEIVERGPNDPPNLSALWIRAIEQFDIDGTPTAVFGGRFNTAFNAPVDGDDDQPGLARAGVFGCDLTNGTVTNLDIPIEIASMTPQGNAVLNERVRALAYDGTWLYVGGKFRIAERAFGDQARPEEFAENAVSLIRVDPRTGAIDPTWRPNIRGSVSALTAHDNWLYVGGGVRLADDAPANRLIRIAIGDGATGTTDAEFRPNVQATIGLGNDDPFAVVLALKVVDNTLVVGGSFQTIDGQPRNSLAAFDLATGTLTDFAPSIGDNNVGTDPIPQIKDVALMPDGSILACGDWWVISPTPGLTWTAYDHDGGAADPNVDPGNWFGQRSKIQPRPNQFNHGKFDLQTGAAAMVNGTPWGPTTDGGIQACDVDIEHNMVILGGHYESSGTYVPGFVPPDADTYPDTHVAYEKVTAVDATTGEIIAWDPDVDSVRGLDAVRVTPHGLIVGGAMTTADRVSRNGVALFHING